MDERGLKIAFRGDVGVGNGVCDGRSGGVDCGSGGGAGGGGGGGDRGSVSIAAIGGELENASPASISPSSSPSHSASRSVSLASPVPSFPSPRSHLPLPIKKTHRFNAVDYEASAILLECRSGALLQRG